MQCPLANKRPQTITIRFGEIWSGRSNQSQLSEPPRGPITGGSSGTDQCRRLGLSTIRVLALVPFAP